MNRALLTRPTLKVPTQLLGKLGEQLEWIPESLRQSRELRASPWSCALKHPEADPNFNTDSGAHGHFGSAVWLLASTTYSELRGLTV